MSTISSYMTTSDFIDRIKTKQTQLLNWLVKQELCKELPLYSSVDIRDAGFKVSVVDTNLFPAGFNNLCEHGLADSVGFLRQALDERVPGCERILIVAEEHTRNTWYLENVRILQEIIQNAGYDVTIATFLTVQPSFCENMNYVELETATGNPVKIYCFKKILKEYENGSKKHDLIILNNDLSNGIPEVLKTSQVPIYPSIQAGWHSRLKSHHFAYTRDVIKEFADILGLDPWFFSALYRVNDEIDINLDADRKVLAGSAAHLLEEIQTKYDEHHISEKPYIVVKGDAGTYGMSVLPIENIDELIHMNRKNRNKLYKGKGSKVVTRYLLQEGVPTIHSIDHKVSEVVMYQIENNLIGGFYRSHSAKSNRENLNSQGMDFQKMCPHSKTYGDCGVHHDVNVFDIYRLLARVAGIAAHREIIRLEDEAKSK